MFENNGKRGRGSGHGDSGVWFLKTPFLLPGKEMACKAAICGETILLLAGLIWKRSILHPSGKHPRLDMASSLLRNRDEVLGRTTGFLGDEGATRLLQTALCSGTGVSTRRSTDIPQSLGTMPLRSLGGHASRRRYILDLFRGASQILAPTVRRGSRSVVGIHYPDKVIHRHNVGVLFIPKSNFRG